MSILVTGGAGFIGSNLVRHLLESRSETIVVLDALTYAGNVESLGGCLDDDRCVFVKGSITDRSLVDATFTQHDVHTVFHLAAESHVDRSIESAAPFIDTNVTGTLVMAEIALKHSVRRFVHVSTDEVYGSLEPDAPAFSEQSQIDPSSPYSASKAASDHVIAAFVRTHGLDAVITRCSNNYGPYQFPEKFVPLMILNALESRQLPIYGDGLQVRDWLHVEDHCRALTLALDRGTSGSVYNIGGYGERANIDVARHILSETDRSEDLLTHVKDRPGHDRRYAIDSTKAAQELGWKPTWTFEDGLSATIEWYRSNSNWSDHVRDGSYRQYYEQHYRTRM